MDELIGYGYAGYHPIQEQKSGHLLLLRNWFGRCLGGTHAELKDANHAMQNALVHHVAKVKTEVLQYREPAGGVYALLWGLQKWKMSTRHEELQSKGRERATVD